MVLDLPKSDVVYNLKQSKKCFKKIGLPAIIRPAFTLGGLGSGIAKNKKEFFKIIKEGLEASPVNSSFGRRVFRGLERI